MPTDTFFTNYKPLEKEPNNWLKDLNTAFQLDANGKLNGVSLALFAGTDTDTISQLKVGNANDLYVDGVPMSDSKIKQGDGTVLVANIGLTGLSVDNGNIRSGEHSELVKIFKDKIFTFITGPVVNLSQARATLRSASVATSVALATNTLTIRAEGGVTPYLVDPLGRSCGINPTTKNREDEIPGANITVNQDNGIIELENAPNGAYTLYLNGVLPEDYRLFLSYMDDTDTKHLKSWGFNNATTDSISFTLDSGNPEKVTINRSPQAPTGLQADAVGTTTLLTRLSWQATGEAGVTK